MRTKRLLALFGSAAVAATVLGSAGCSDNTNYNGKFVTDGLPLISASDYTEEGTALVTKEYTLTFENGGVQVKNENGMIMFLQDQPAMVTVMQQGNSLMSFDEFLYAGKYATTIKNDYGIGAVATVTTDLGSVFKVYDQWFVIGEGTFGMSRNVIIEKAVKKDAGFNSSFKMHALSKSTKIDDYDFTIPSLVYKDSSAIPTYAIGANLDVPALYAKETAMGMPFIHVYEKATENSLTIGHYQPEVDGGKVGGGYNGDIDASIRYGSVGYDKNEAVGLDAGFVWPCSEGPTTYTSNGWTKRFHPVEEGGGHSYKVSVIPLAGESYLESFAYSTMKTLKGGYPELYNVDIDELYDVSMQTLSNVWYQKGSGSDDPAGFPLTINLVSGITGSNELQIGFTGMETSLAAQMIQYGSSVNNTEMVSQAERIINFWTGSKAFPSNSALPITWYRPNTNDPFPATNGEEYPAFLRMITDGFNGILDAIRVKHELEETVPVNWTKAVEKVGQFFLDNQNEDGSVYRAYNRKKGTVNTNSSNKVYAGTSKVNTSQVVPFLFKMSEYSVSMGNGGKAEEYKTAALKAVDWALNNLEETGKYVGGTIDQANIVDKEAGFFALKAFTAAYMSTNEQKYLDAARHAAAFCMGWVYTYDFAIQSSNPLTQQYNPFTEGGVSGFSIIATGHSGADIFSAFFPTEIYKMYVLTGDTDYRDAAIFLELNTKQTTNWDGRLGYAEKGFSPEATQAANFNYTTVDAPGIWLPWLTDANLRPITDAKNIFGVSDYRNLTDNRDVQLANLMAYGQGGKWN